MLETTSYVDGAVIVIAKLARNEGSSNPGKTERAAMGSNCVASTRAAMPSAVLATLKSPVPTVCNAPVYAIRSACSPGSIVRPSATRHWRFVLSSVAVIGRAPPGPVSAMSPAVNSKALSTMPSTGRRDL